MNIEQLSRVLATSASSRALDRVTLMVVCIDFKSLKSSVFHTTHPRSMTSSLALLQYLRTYSRRQTGRRLRFDLPVRRQGKMPVKSAVCGAAAKNRNSLCIIAVAGSDNEGSNLCIII